MQEKRSLHHINHSFLECIRNICILAHVDHGKTSLADCLVANNGIISKRLVGLLRYLDHLEQEQLRGITMKSSAISLSYCVTGLDCKADSVMSQCNGISENTNYLINLIDTPGHIDFSSEVSTAVRLCDGALIVVDVVEGVCPQTRAVLKQAWQERLKTILVINKMDRLINELRLTPQAACEHIARLLEKVNAVTAEYYTAHVMYAARTKRQMDETSISSKENDTLKSMPNVTTENTSNIKSNISEISLSDDVFHDLGTTDDTKLYFSPVVGNVIFASAIDSWAFCIQDFAKFYSTKFGCKAAILQHTLWGDYWLHNKDRKVFAGAASKGKKSLFVQLILEQLWSVYDAVLVTKETAKISRIIETLGLSIPSRDLNYQDGRMVVRAICGRWLPIANCILKSIVDCCPAPNQLSEEKIESLMSRTSLPYSALPAASRALKSHFLSCHSDANSPVIVFVSKMFSADINIDYGNKKSNIMCNAAASHAFSTKSADELADIRRTARSQGANSTGDSIQTIDSKEELSVECKGNADNCELQVEEDGLEQFMAFARVFSGTVTPGQKVFVLGPKHNPAKIPADMQSAVPSDFPIGSLKHVNCDHVHVAEIGNVYQLMAREFKPLTSMPAGNVVGLSGLGHVIHKSGTLSSTLLCPAFTDLYTDVAPLVCVAVAPCNPLHLRQFEHSLDVCVRADPCAMLRREVNGENVLCAAGEIHLQKLLQDLKEKFAPGMEFSVSKFIVPFRETLMSVPGSVEVIKHVSRLPNDPHKALVVKVSAVALPQEISDLLYKNEDLLSEIMSIRRKSIVQQRINYSTLDFISRVKHLQDSIMSVCESLEDTNNTVPGFGPWQILLGKHLCAFGVRGSACNVLINNCKGYQDRPCLYDQVLCNTTLGQELLCHEAVQFVNAFRYRQFDQGMISGFQEACSKGPLFEEPMFGVAFIMCGIEERDVDLGVVMEEMEFTGKDSSGLRSHTELDTSDESSLYLPFKSNSGQLMTAVCNACIQSFKLHHKPRLMLAMYLVQLLVRAEVMGKLYAVLNRRHSRIILEDMHEGEPVFDVHALIPVVESFGLAEELQKKTSGMAQPQLQFSHWELLDADAVRSPIEDNSVLSEMEREARECWVRVHRYVGEVRRRKGLSVREQLVEFGDKQRTLSKKK